MTKETAIKLFENKQVRVCWDEKTEKWYLSVVDVISTLTESSIPKRYWSDLKKKLTLEGSQLYEKIVQLKFEATDGKKYATDCLETQDIFRLIQSIPSPKAEPFKLLKAI
jgi:general stress protein 26